MPESERASKASGRGSGPSMPESFASYDPATSLWRTSQLSLVGDLEPFLETWPRAGMTRNGIAFPLLPLAPLTAATGSSSWPTPTVRDHKDTGPNTDYAKVAAKRKLAGAVAMRWPTPRATGGLCGGSGHLEMMRGLEELGVVTNDEVRSMTPGHGGSLNPTWVEWLMGFPLGWTDCEPSETPSSPRSPSSSDAA
jgi:hypothetical protein